jgi:hypothetical protein
MTFIDCCQNRLATAVMPPLASITTGSGILIFCLFYDAKVSRKVLYCKQVNISIIFILKKNKPKMACPSLKVLLIAYDLQTTVLAG